jgi:polyphosphate kinase
LHANQSFSKKHLESIYNWSTLLGRKKKKFSFINRELSWLDFNERVLELSNDNRIPLMERLKFISIFSNNLDEFFMIRVAGIVDQIDLGYEDKDKSNLSPKEVFDKIRQKVKRLLNKQTHYFYRLRCKLSQYGVDIKNSFNECSGEYCELLFEHMILPSISPITLSPSNPFPFIYNKRSAFIVEMEKDGKDYTSIIIIPDGLKKLYANSENLKLNVFTLEHIIANKLKELFKGYEIENYYIIRATRNADLSIEEEESEDLLISIDHQLDKRRKGQIVRLEINKEPSKKIEKLLLENFDIDKEDIYITSDFIDMSAFFELKSDNTKLYYKPFKSYLPKDMPFNDRIFDYIKKNELLLYRPYNDFSLISKLIEIAAKDKKTLSIKMTIYRANRDSSIIKNLIKAAENGKAVFVVIELKARFDEEMNVEWARLLEEAGCVVTYGIPGLKVHSKNLLITRNENGKIVKYSHVATGNYNEQTAKIYTDLDYITSNEALGLDNANLFNYLMGYTDFAKWNRITIAPKYLRNKIMELIDSEISFAKLGKKAHIIIKVNSIIDKKLIEKLYDASNSGVKIDLIVRGICGIKTDIKNMSENIRVISIVGRFLEHPRIFYFYSNAKERIFMSSADFMERNMDRRIEHMIEITAHRLKDKLKNLLELNINDNTNAWELHKSYYKKIKPTNDTIIDSQDFYITHTF